VQFFALAADYDDTLARDGQVSPSTCDALGRLKASGRKLLLVTGRELPELKAVFPELELFDRVVAENGALLFDPATGAERELAPPPPPQFVAALRASGVSPLSAGRVIVATREPHEAAVLEAIRSLGLELKIVFNMGAVMVLPDGVTKATGLAAALAELGLSPHNVVGVGNAENDHAFLRTCGAAAAVANALPMLKRESTLVLRHERGAGVAELIGLLLDDEASLISDERLALPLGRDRQGRDVRVSPVGGAVLIAGPVGSGKSALARALMAAMRKAGFQYCAIDSKGSHVGATDTAAIGGAKPSRIDETVNLLRAGGPGLVINAQGFELADGPAFLDDFVPEALELRARCGRPHWLVIDDVGELLQESGSSAGRALPPQVSATVYIAAEVSRLPDELLRAVRWLVALGGDAAAVLEAFCTAAALPALPPEALPRNGEALYWDRGGKGPPHPITPVSR
jgi:hydroxymethylpyrimidine pyrophosphatase-like HAD family hydrolase